MVWECQKQCHDTTLRSQNAEQLRENGWLRCRCKPQSFKTYDSSELGVWSLRKSKVNVHDTTLRSQNAEQLRENGWLRCSRKPQSFKTYDSSEFGVWSSSKGSVQTAKLTKNYQGSISKQSHEDPQDDQRKDFQNDQTKYLA